MTDLRNTRTIVLNTGNAPAKRTEILDYFHQTLTIDEKLYDTLAGDEAFFLRAEPLRHPLIFYLGHTGVFYINKLITAKLIDQRINPKFESMFAVGVDEMSWDDLDDAHYGDTYFNVENFPVHCTRLCVAFMKGRPKRRALDLGCAVGRSTFELARTFNFVSGLDFSARFIRIASQMQENGVAHYQLVEEGDIASYHERHLSDFGLDTVTDRVEFFQADATNLKPTFTGYDLVLAANLIDRLYDPNKFLTTIHERLNMGGILVLTSPYTWLEEFTRRENWVGGVRRDGEPYTTLDGLKDMLADHFKMIAEPRDVEFVIRETRRKFQHTLSQLTAWERVA